MVFEGVVSDVLSRVLGEYVKNLNKDQLKIGVLGGNVVLTNLELKEDALANLPINLPITIKKGFLGRLELRVPWKDLKSKPVIVNIDNVYALAVPQTQNYKYDEAAERKREMDNKKKRIENYEWMKSIKDDDNNNSNSKKDDSFTDRLVTKIIDNLQIVINKIHIRFENRNEIGKLYAIGVTLDRISAQSTDERWIPSFIDSTKTNYIRKLAEMNALGVYIDDSATSLQNLSTQEFSDAFLKAIPTKIQDSPLLSKFIIKPISSQLKVSINKNEKIEKSIPKMLADCIFSDIVIALSSTQYHTIFNVLSFTNEFLRDIKYLKYRPNTSVKENPRLWWKYVGQVTLEQIRQKRFTRSWPYLMERRNDRKAYINLFKRSLPNVKWLTPLNKSEVSQLALIEDRISFEDIVFYRSLAYAEIKVEATKNKERKEFLDSKKNERGFFQNLFSSKAVKMEDEKAAPIVQLSTTERDELYKTIEYSDVMADTVEEPDDWVKVVANLEIRSISLQLVDTDSSTGLEYSFIDAVYSHPSIKFEQRKEGVKVVAGIKQFEVYDQFTKGTLYPKIVTSSAAYSSSSFCSVIVDTRPPDKDIDLFIELAMNPLQVVAPKPLLMRVASFFTSSVEQVDLTNITNRAGDMLVNWTERTKSQLQEAIDSHKIMSLAVNIQAPVFILPENVLVKNSNALILDLGNFKVRSDMSKQQFKGKVVSDSMNQDDFYDKFNISLESIQLLLTNDIASWNDKHVQTEQKTHLINQFDVHLQLYSCIQQDNLSLTNVKVFGDLPNLSLHLSEKKLNQLLKLFNSIMDKETLNDKSNEKEKIELIHDIPTSSSSSSKSNNLLDLYNHNQKLNDSQNSSIDLLMNHKKINLEFKVTSINLTISRENFDLIRLNVDGLNVNFAQRTFDSIGLVELSSLSIDDLYTKSDLKKLATCSNPINNQNNNSLVKINFKQFQPNSPEFKKIDMNLDINFYSFYLVCNPPTINQILLLVNSLQDQPSITIKRSAVAVTENRKRQVRSLRTPAGTTTSPSTTSPTTTPSTTSPTLLPTSPGGSGKKVVVKKVLVKKKKKPISDNISIKISANIESLGVLLNQENNKKVGIFSINNVSTNLTMYKDTRMSVQGSLGSIKLEDLTDKSGIFYRYVITPHASDKAMLSFAFNTHPKILANYPGYDSSVEANIESIVVNAQIAFLLQVQNYFLGGMLDPILKKPIAVEPSAENGGRLEAILPPVSRTKIDVVMSTPMFNVPRAGDSDDKLHLELGKIIVSNSFATHPKALEEPVDIMKITMENTNIIIQKDNKKSSFLKELTIDINLTRFLKPNHHIEIPDLQIDISITQLGFFLDQQQYRFFLELADCATREMADMTMSTIGNQPEPPTNDVPYFSEQEVIRSMGKVVMSLKVHLPLLSFTIKSTDDTIAQFDMRGFLVDIISTEKKKTKIQMLMESIVLSDARSNSNNIFKNLLENHPDKKQPLAPFLNIGYIRDNELGDQYINVNINNIFLFLSPTPLLIISKFFIIPNNNNGQLNQSKQLTNSSTASLPTLSNNNQSISTHSSIDDQYSDITKPVLRIPSITMTCSLRSEITLVENETQPNTRCILGKCMLHLFFKRDPRGMENAILSVRKAKVNIYRPSHKEISDSQGSRPVQILKPIDHIKINYIKENQTTEYWKQTVTLECSAIKLFFSYDDLNTIVKILNNLNLDQFKEDSSGRQQLSSSTGSATSSYSTISNVEEFDQDDLGDNTSLAGSFQPSASDVDMYVTNETMSFKCPSISLLFINESMDLNLPVAELYLADIKAGATNWSSDLEFKTGMTFKADYFNEGNLKFEPLIEDWTFNFEVKKNGAAMRAKFIATKDTLNINVSHALIQTLNSTLLLVKQKDAESSSPLSSRFNQSNSILSKLIKNNDNNNSGTTEKFRSHWISNQTGLDISYMIKHKEFIAQHKEGEDDEDDGKAVQDIKEHSHTVMIKNQELISIKIKQVKGNRDAGIGIHETVDLYILQGVIKNVSLDAIGHTIYELEQLLIDVEVKLQRDGSKIVYIRSMTQICNNTKSSVLEIKFDQNESNIVQLQPSGNYTLPLELTFQKLFIRPLGSKQWSEQIIPSEIVMIGQKEEKKQNSKESPQLSSHHNNFNCASYYKNIKTAKEDGSNSWLVLSVQENEYKSQKGRIVKDKTQIISINPPIIIENLLPLAINLSFVGSNGVNNTLQCGEKMDVLNFVPGNDLQTIITVPQFPAGKFNLLDSKQIKFGKDQLLLNIERNEETKGVKTLSVYSQYWLVNNSLLPLSIKGGDGDEIVMPTNNNQVQNAPILYTSTSIKLKVNETNCKYTNSTPICTVGNVRTVQIPGETKNYQVSYSVEFCNNSKFGQTKIVTFSPRYIIQNQLNQPISIKELNLNNNNSNNNNKNNNIGNNSSMITLNSEEFLSYHGNNVIQIKVGDDYQWSGPLEIETSGDMVIKLRPIDAMSKPTILAHVTIKEEKGILYIIIPKVNPEYPPYLIENDTPYHISYYQKTNNSNSINLYDHVDPNQKELFGWDEPMGEHRLVVFIEGKQMAKTINMKKITGYTYDGVAPNVYITITIEKASRLVQFSTNSKKYKSIRNWKSNAKKSSKSRRQQDQGVQGPSELQFFIRLSGLGLSLVDGTPRELAYISMKDMLLTIQQSSYENSLELKIGDIQIDNQSVKTEFPVLMHSVMKPNANKDFLHISIVKSNFANIDHFRYFSTLIQELTIDIEDHWLRMVLEFVQSLPDIQQTLSQTNPSGATDIYGPELIQSLTSKFNISPPKMEGLNLKMVYFALLVLNPIKTNITLALQPDGLFKTNHKVLSAIEGLGFTLTKLDRAPISLQGLIMEHPFSSWSTMIDKLKETYTSQALFQFYNILGSIDIIGNPVGLFRNFGTGVKDFFVEPANGIIKSPTDFGKGLAKGTSSLVKNSVYGTFNTISKITGTIGSGVANLSFDDEYMHDRKIQQSRKPKHIGEGLAMGGIGLGRGLFQGLTGIVTKPVEGAKKGGFAGFAKGLAQGVVGVAVKPTTAVIDATTKATEGIRNTTNLQDDKDRVRPPRCFGQDNVLRPYDEQESEGWYLLKTVHKGKHSADNYVWHYPVNNEFTVILSDERLIYARTKKNFLHSSFMWQVPHRFIKEVVLVPGNGILLKFDPPQDLGLLDKSIKSTTIPITNDNINITFNMKLDHTLRLFNEKLNTIYKL